MRKDEHAKARASSGECCAAKGRNDAHSADAHAARVRSTVQADGLTLRAWGEVAACRLATTQRACHARHSPGTKMTDEPARTAEEAVCGLLRADGMPRRPMEAEAGPRPLKAAVGALTGPFGAGPCIRAPIPRLVALCPPEGRRGAKRGQPGYRPNCHTRRIPPLPLVRD